MPKICNYTTMLENFDVKTTFECTFDPRHNSDFTNTILTIYGNKERNSLNKEKIEYHLTLVRWTYQFPVFIT